MKILKTLWVGWLVLAGTSVLTAKNIYVAQTGSGTTNSLSWLNTAANWGAGASQINPGDTVHLVGQFTSALTLQGSGTAGNPITIYFEPGANFTSACWPNSGAIILNGRSYITIDGGVNGLIQNTANGTGLANQSPSMGIIGGITFGVIKNLTITNIYNRITGSDANPYGNCISVSGSSITISNCNLSDANGVLMYSGPKSGDTVRSNIFILNNRILNWNHGISIGVGDSSVGPANVLLTNVVVAGNFLDHADRWDGSPAGFHMDGMIIFNNTYDSTVVINGLYIYNNIFGPNFYGNTSLHGNTAGIAEYLDGGVSQCQNTFVYNNVFQTYSTNAWANGFVNAGGSNVWVFNNTCQAIGSGSISRGSELNVTGVKAYCYNNILCPGAGISLNAIYGMTNTSIVNNAANNAFVLQTYFGGVWSDYNLIQPGANGANSFSLGLTQDLAAGDVWLSGIFNTLQKWQTYIDNRFGWPTPIWNTLHCDPHSKTSKPTYNVGTYVPALTDTTAHGAGTNLTMLGVTKDILGNPRPITGNWDIGAYQATSAAPRLPEVTGFHIVTPPPTNGQ